MSARTQTRMDLTPAEVERSSSLCKSAFLAAVSISICVPARAPLILRLKKGDAAATAKTLGLMSTCAAAIELILNPVLGRLSDKYGRKPFLMMSVSVSAILHSMVAAFPKSLAVNFTDRCITGAMVFCFFNPMRAALQDLFAGQSLTKLGAVGARLGSAFGMGFAVGPLIGSKLAAEKAFAGSALMFAMTSAYVGQKVEETHPAIRRTEFDLAAANPLSFVRLFKTMTMAKLCTAIGLGSFADYANIYDVNFLFMKTVMGYGQQEVGLFATGFGVTQIFGGEAAKNIIAHYGQTTYTAVANAAYIVGFALLGSANNAQQLAAALAAIMFGHQRSGQAMGLLAEHASSEGMGRGEIAGAQANFIAVLKIIAPMLYGQTFAWSTSDGRKMAGAPYFLICLFVAASQFIFGMVPMTEKPK